MKNKITIEVPQGIRFLSKWTDFNLSNFPNKCIILDKQIPGCGFTEYCINSLENVILCSPRKILLENKWGQHKKEVYLVRNEMDKDLDIDKDISKDKKDRRTSLASIKKEEDQKEKVDDNDKEKNSIIYDRLNKEIREYVYYCINNNIPSKILVTYDSYRIVQQILIDMGLFDKFYTVVDEFQSILHDARFKSDTEMKFMNYLKKSHSAFFVSATPMMDEYISMLTDFKDLPYFELDWHTLDKTRVIKPDLDVYLMRSVGEKAKEIIDTYLNGDFKKIVVIRNGKPVEIESREAVLYVNSVNHIISIIKKSNLKPEQVNILCSNTEENKLKIRRKLGKEFNIGIVPLEGEPHKMFTFCTRTVYLGADFYSLCARTFIFSDSNSDCLAVDISEDLPQILGRQRLFENPWKNNAEFYYRTTADYREMKWENFKNILENKERTTENLLKAYNEASNNFIRYDLAKKYQKDAINSSYRDDYISVNRIINDKTGDIILKPVRNELVFVNELRAFRIQQIDYRDRFSVFTTIHNQLTPDDRLTLEISRFMDRYESFKTKYDKLRFLCECGYSVDIMNVIINQIPESDEIRSYYTALGPQRLRALSYDITKIRKVLGIITFSQDLLLDSIYSSFKEGEKYTLANLKLKLSQLYSSINYSSTPKANDIEKYFDIKEYSQYEKTLDGSRKKIRGYELLKSKEQELREELKHTN